MKRQILEVVGALAFVVAASACTPGQRQVLRTALDITQTLCIVANAQSDDATVAQVCGITEALLPEMRRLASAQRTAAAQHARNVGACK